MSAPDYDFLRSIGRILNSGQSRSVVLTGNVYDLFYLEQEDDYVSPIRFLAANWNLSDVILAVYEINGPIRFGREGDRDRLRDAWLRWRSGFNADEMAIKRMLAGKKTLSFEIDTAEAFEHHMQSAIGNPTLALELLRQMCFCSRSELDGEPFLPEKLIILIEAADLIIPEGEITALSDVDRHRVSICHDWFSDPGFLNGDDSVVLVSESRSLLNHRVARLPQVLEVQAPSPDETVRKHFISWFGPKRAEGARLTLWGTQDELAKLTAGLSIQAMMQLLKGAAHEGRELSQQDVVGKVEEFIQSQLGEDIVEFKKPDHKLEDVVGFTRLKAFLKDELIPRFSSSGPDALPGAAVSGPIGSGKTYIFEAVAAELDMVVLVLKNIRSQWFGQTDVIFERLRRVLEALSKVLIFVDEADTQFGGVGPDAHETERRLTGKIQAMMSDPKLRGRVIWLLMTARIHRLSPDIRRPGRVGDLIIPVLDPEGEDRKAFIGWAIAPVLHRELTEEESRQLDATTKEYAASSFASLRSELQAKARRRGGSLTFDDVLTTANDHVSPAIGEARRYQTLQALVNCTRKSLLPNPNVDPSERQSWLDEIHLLEQRGIQ